MNNAATLPTMSLRRSALWSLLGNTFVRASQWGVLAVMAHFGRLEDLGRFGLAMAICNPLSMLANLQLGAVLATDAQQHTSFRVYGVLRLAASVLATLLVAAGC
ncbi:MAG: hypothetical protein KDA37_14425, partial [Planctomycetales bacterium]|nr:hypothetical protein [Planctomycetales bacterium]